MKLATNLITDVGDASRLEARVRIFGADKPTERRAWLDLWSRWPEREPVAHPAYLEAIGAVDERPMCASLDLVGGGVLYPFLIRPVDRRLTDRENNYSDITGPLFGYTGAFRWNVGNGIAERFWREFGSWARQENVVSSFARLSLFHEDLLPFDGRTRFVQPNVVRDLQLQDDLLWFDVEHKVRKNVKRARNEGVVIDRDPEFALLDAFIEIYATTMQRRQASPRYGFKRDFFDSLIAQMPGAIQLYVARVGETVVSAELILMSTHHAYSFLGGTVEEAFSLRPNDLLKYEIIRRLRDQGLTHFVLGGGPRPGDGIFRYKRSFAPGGVVDFKVGEQVHDTEAYAALVRQRALRASQEGMSWSPPPDFFPAYRAG